MSVNETADLAVFESNGTATLERDIQALKSGDVNVFSSMASDSFEDRVSMLEKMTNSTPLDAMLDTPFNLAHFIIQPIEMPDEKTGEIQAVPRVILIDAEGNSYHAISTGIFSSLKNIAALLGMPGTWPVPVKVTAKREKTRSGYNVFTLKMTK